MLVECEQLEFHTEIDIAIREDSGPNAKKSIQAVGRDAIEITVPEKDRDKIDTIVALELTGPAAEARPPRPPLTRATVLALACQSSAITDHRPDTAPLPMGRKQTIRASRPAREDSTDHRSPHRPHSTPLKRARPSRMTSSGVPISAATETAASALSTLCRPGRFKVTSSGAYPSRRQRKRMRSPCTMSMPRNQVAATMPATSVVAPPPNETTVTPAAVNKRARSPLRRSRNATVG